MNNLNQYIVEKLKINKDIKIKKNSLDENSKDILLAVKDLVEYLIIYEPYSEKVFEEIYDWVDKYKIKSVKTYVDKLARLYIKDTSKFHILPTMDYIKFKRTFNLPGGRAFKELSKSDDNKFMYYSNKEIFYIDTDHWDVMIVNTSI